MWASWNGSGARMFVMVYGMQVEWCMLASWGDLGILESEAESRYAIRHGDIYKRDRLRPFPVSWAIMFLSDRKVIFPPQRISQPDCCTELTWSYSDRLKR